MFSKIFKSKTFLYVLSFLTLFHMGLATAQLSYTEIYTALFENLASAPTRTAEGMLYYNSTDKKFYYHNGTQFKEVGSGGGGGLAINYFDDIDADTTTNVSTYDDGADPPTDGTGGTVDYVSVSSETSAPIYGDASYKLSKTDNTATGEGWAIQTNVTLDDAADSGRTQTVQFFYKTSANYEDDDVCLYVYKDNSGREALSGQNGISTEPSHCLPAISSGVGSFTATFNYDGTDTYGRIIWNIADANGGAWNLTIDRIFIGDNIANIVGPKWTDAKNYTPTYSASLGSVTHDFAEYRQLGDLMHLRGRFTTGTVTTGVATISLPGSFSSSTSGITGGGQWHAGVASTADFSRGTFQISDASNTITMADDFSTAGSSGTALNAANANVILSSSTVYAWEVVVPIAEWQGNSTNILNSTQMLLRRGHVRAFRTSSTQSVNTATDTKVVFNSRTYDELNAFDVSTGDYTCKVTAKHRVYSHIQYAAWSTGVSTVYLKIYKNGSEIASNYNTTQASVSQNWNAWVEDVIDCNEGDTISIYTYQNSGATRNINNGSTVSYVSITPEPDPNSTGNAGVPYDYQETTAASTVATTVANTLTEAFGTSNRLTLNPGTHELCFTGTLQFTISSGSSLYCRAFMYNISTGSLSNVVGTPVGGYHALGSSTVLTTPMRSCAEVTISSEQTFSVGLEASEATANGNCRFASQSWTGAITNPDFDLHFSARRTK